MRWVLLLLLASLPGRAAETMRIAIAGEVPRVVISAEGLLLGDDDDEALFAAHGAPTATVTQAHDVLAVDGRASPRPAVRFRGGVDGVIAVNGFRVRGDVVVLKGRTQLQPVNVLPLEDYLVGVLASEMPVSFPAEALKAQAVAARTYALTKKLEQYGQPYHLGSSVLSQVYQGHSAEDPRARDAVDATRGLVVTWMLQPIEAYFHASCGGRTESGKDALGRDLPYLRPVDCPCGHLDQSRWRVTLGRADLKKLGASLGGSLRVKGRSPTGRARDVTIGGRLVDAVTFRARLGYTRIKSLAFEVEHERGGWTVEGHGYGHGAGLCQWGARLYAEKGWDYRKILAHYYPDTELQQLYE